MKGKTRKFIADQLLLTADLLELLTGDATEPDHYRQGASYLRQSQELLLHAPTDEDLKMLAQIAADVVLDAEALWRTGQSELLMRLQERIPASVAAMLSLHGLGPKRLRVVWKQLGITDIASLSHAVSENRLLGEKGFGPKTQAKIKESIAQARLQRDRYPMIDLRPTATVLEHELRELLGPAARMDFTGEYRRGCTTCDGIEMLLDAGCYKQVLLHMVQSETYEIMTAAQDMVLARLRGSQVPLTFYFSSAHYYLDLFRRSGSAAHIASIPVDAHQNYRSEAEIYAAARLPYIPACLRENAEDLVAFKTKGLPRLVQHTDIRGLLHVHTDHSDGDDSLEAMAMHCEAMGMHYIGISDHGPHHRDGHRMSLEAIHIQHREIDRLNLRMAPFKILKGIELDILEDGSLGMADEELEKFDFVIAALHETEELTIVDATMRIIRAINNPYTTILGHLSGRMLFGRDAQPMHLDAIFDACATHDVALEINCHPDRMDLDWETVRLAVAAGVQIAINPNAHSASALHDYEYGLDVARKGMVGPSRTVNAKSTAQIEEFLHAKRRLRIT